MDKKEFKARLAELVDFEELTPKVLREERSENDESQQVFFEGSEIEIDREHNPTLGIRLTRLKPKYAACEIGCGDVVANQVVQRMHYATPVKHWRTKCDTCGKYAHPSGEGFISSEGTSIATEFNLYFRKLEKAKYLRLMKESKPRG